MIDTNKVKNLDTRTAFDLLKLAVNKDKIGIFVANYAIVVINALTMIPMMVMILLLSIVKFFIKGPKNAYKLLSEYYSFKIGRIRYLSFIAFCTPLILFNLPKIIAIQVMLLLETSINSKDSDVCLTIDGKSYDEKALEGWIKEHQVYTAKYSKK